MFVFNQSIRFLVMFGKLRYSNFKLKTASFGGSTPSQTVFQIRKLKIIFPTL